MTRARIAVSLLVASLGSSSVAAFTLITNGGKPAYWANRQFAFYIGRDGSTNFTDGWDGKGGVMSEFDAIRAAMTGGTEWMTDEEPTDVDHCHTWGQLSGATFSFQDLGLVDNPIPLLDQKNMIFFVSSGWTTLSFRPPRNALAVTVSSFDSEGRIVDADVVFNNEHFDWAVVDTPEEENDAIDVQNIATHEIGHALGLDHSSQQAFEPNELLEQATMYYAASVGEIHRRCLNEDDARAFRNLYPSTEPDPPALTAIDLKQGVSGEFVVVNLEGANFNENTFFLLTVGNEAVYDAYGRSVELSSTSKASVLFDLTGMRVGVYDVVAYNSPTQSARLPGAFTINASAAAATSSGESGGGGCTTGLNDVRSNYLGWWLPIPLLLLIWARRRTLRPESAR